MASERALKIIRAGLLVALLAWFAGSVGCALLRQEHAQGYGRLPSAPGSDPGIRVLLLNRPRLLDRAPPQPSRSFDQIVVRALVPLEVASPDNPDNPDLRASLPVGSEVRIQSDVNSGLVLSSRAFGSGGKDFYWPITRVLLTPRDTEPAAVEGSRDRRDPSSFEAAGRRPAFAIGKGRFRGSLEVRWAGSKEVLAINCLPVEAYLAGVVAVEMSPSYPLEALKAQAIASRGYCLAKAKRSRLAQQPWDLTDGHEDQEYGGAGASTDLCLRAAYETSGLTPLIRGHLFPVMFHAASGGRIGGIDAIAPGAKDVDGAMALSSVMPPQDDPWCEPAVAALGKESTHGRTVTVVEPKIVQREVGRWLTAVSPGRTLGFVKDIRIGRRDPVSGRALSVVISHSAQNQGEILEVPAHVFRQLMSVPPNPPLRSTLWLGDGPRKFESPTERGKWYYEFTCQGWGHGAGMSQVSAWLMARQGWSAERIINRFYPGADLQRLW
jgi:hypothetical protein